MKLQKVQPKEFRFSRCLPEQFPTSKRFPLAAVYVLPLECSSLRTKRSEVWQSVLRDCFNLFAMTVAQHYYENRLRFLKTILPLLFADVIDIHKICQKMFLIFLWDGVQSGVEVSRKMKVLNISSILLILKN